MLLLYITPLLIGALIGIFLIHNIVLRYRYAHGATALLALVIAATLWSVGYALEIASLNLTTNLFWAKFQYLGIVVIPPAWLIFAVRFRGYTGWLERATRNQFLLWIIPALTLCLVWTNEMHHLVWRQVELVTFGELQILQIDHGPWFWVFWTFTNCLLLLGSIGLATSMFRSRPVDRRMIGLALMGILIPWIANLLYITGLNPLPYLDWTPFSFVLAGLMFVLSLLHFKLFNISTIAHTNVFKGLADSILVLDVEDCVVDLNPAALQMIGNTDQTPLGQPFAQLLPEFAAPCDGLDRATELQIEISHGKEPDLRFYHIRVAPLANEKGMSIGRLVTLRDITQRKQDHAELEKIRNQLEKRVFEQTAELERINPKLQMELEQRTLAEKRFEQIVQLAPDALFLIDQDHQIALMNTQAEKIFGYSRDELLGKDIQTLIPKTFETRHHQLMDEYFAGPAVRPMGALSDIYAERKNGLVFPVEISLSPLDMTNETMAICIVRDISKRKEAEQEQTQLLEQIKQSQVQMRALTTYIQEVQENERRQISSILHDHVGQKLTGLNLNLKIVQEHLPPESKEIIQNRLNISLQLVEEITRQVRFVMADLHPPILEEYGLISALEWYGIEFSQMTGIKTKVNGLEFEPRLPPSVEIVLFRIVNEALNNIAKHSLAKKVNIDVKSSAETAHLMVEDDGVGFDPEVVNLPNGQPHWGLLTMQQRAISIGGQLTIDSIPGAGTHLLISFPRRAQDGD